MIVTVSAGSKAILNDNAHKAESSRGGGGGGDPSRLHGLQHCCVAEIFACNPMQESETC